MLEVIDPKDGVAYKQSDKGDIIAHVDNIPDGAKLGLTFNTVSKDEHRKDLTSFSSCSEVVNAGLTFRLQQLQAEDEVPLVAPESVAEKWREERHQGHSLPGLQGASDSGRKALGWICR